MSPREQSEGEKTKQDKTNNKNDTRALETEKEGPGSAWGGCGSAEARMRGGARCLGDTGLFGASPSVQSTGRCHCSVAAGQERGEAQVGDRRQQAVVLNVGPGTGSQSSSPAPPTHSSSARHLPALCLSLPIWKLGILMGSYGYGVSSHSGSSPDTARHSSYHELYYVTMHYLLFCDYYGVSPLASGRPGL